MNPCCLSHSYDLNLKVNQLEGEKRKLAVELAELKAKLKAARYGRVEPIKDSERVATVEDLNTDALFDNLSRRVSEHERRLNELVDVNCKISGVLRGPEGAMAPGER